MTRNCVTDFAAGNKLSALTDSLNKKTIQAWRDFSATPEFEHGMMFLRHNHAPKPGGANEVELVKSAIGWDQYMKALQDVEEVLTFIPQVERSADEPSLEKP